MAYLNRLTVEAQMDQQNDPFPTTACCGASIKGSANSPTGLCCRFCYITVEYDGSVAEAYPSPPF